MFSELLLLTLRVIRVDRISHAAMDMRIEGSRERIASGAELTTEALPITRQYNKAKVSKKKKMKLIAITDQTKNVIQILSSLVPLQSFKVTPLLMYVVI